MFNLSLSVITYKFAINPGGVVFAKVSATGELSEAFTLEHELKGSDKVLALEVPTLVVFPLSLVDIAVAVCEGSVAVAEIFFVAAGVDTPIGELVDAFSFFVSFLKGSFVHIAVWVSHYSFAFSVSVHESTFVDTTITKFISSLAVELSFYPIAHVLVAIWVFWGPFAIYFAILELPVIFVAIFEAHEAMAVELVVNELTLKETAVTERYFTLATDLIVLELSLVHRLVRAH